MNHCVLSLLAFIASSLTISVLSPPSLQQVYRDGVPARFALFGPMPYGSYVAGKVLQVSSSCCKECRPSGFNASEPAVFLVPRGICSFDTMVHYAEAAGARAVIIYNYNCLQKFELMESAGYYNNVSIPSAMIDYGTANDLLAVKDDIFLNITFESAYQSSEVEVGTVYALMNIFDWQIVRLLPSILDFGSSTVLKPYFALLDCPDCGRLIPHPDCLCNNHYCSIQHPQGALVVRESVRQQCVYQLSNRTSYVAYMTAWDQYCKTRPDRECTEGYNAAGVSAENVQQCYLDSFGGDVNANNNTLLATARAAFNQLPLYFIPAIVVAGDVMHGDYLPATLERMICAHLSVPHANCSHYFCAPGCWHDMLSNLLCDPACNVDSCGFDSGACGATTVPTNNSTGEAGNNSGGNTTNTTNTGQGTTNTTNTGQGSPSNTTNTGQGSPSNTTNTEQGSPSNTTNTGQGSTTNTTNTGQGSTTNTTNTGQGSPSNTTNTGQGSPSNTTNTGQGSTPNATEGNSSNTTNTGQENSTNSTGRTPLNITNAGQGSSSNTTEGSPSNNTGQGSTDSTGGGQSAGTNNTPSNQGTNTTSGGSTSTTSGSGSQPPNSSGPVIEPCSPGCNVDALNSSTCVPACNNANCSYQNWVCTCVKECSPNMLQNGICDLACNVPLCNFDNGDCIRISLPADFNPDMFNRDSQDNGVLDKPWQKGLVIGLGGAGFLAIVAGVVVCCVCRRARVVHCCVNVVCCCVKQSTGHERAGSEAVAINNKITPSPSSPSTAGYGEKVCPRCNNGFVPIAEKPNCPTCEYDQTVLASTTSNRG